MPPLRNTGQAPEAERPGYAGRYLLESVLGSGGMGAVHLATSASGLRLAVKIIHPNHASDPEFRARFRQEIAAARRVSGAFTASVVDADPEAERPWMATLFIDGPTLSERVKRNGPLDTEELIRLGAGLAEGLRDIHRAGVVHRDLKPSNVLLAADGPKVIDFGISRATDSDLRTETGRLIGTPPFMAPEQFQRPREVGPAADVFAMGAVLVHAATGRGPFDSDSPYIVAYQVVHDEPELTGVPESLVPLVARCLAKEPEDRPTPDELMTALRASRQGTATPLVPARREPRVTAGDPTPTTHPKAARSLGSRLWTVPFLTGARHRHVRRLAVGVVLAALAGAGLVGVLATQSEDPPKRPPAGTPASRAFRAWSTALPGGDASAGHAPSCSAADWGIYCAGPGVTAARLDPADGRTTWTVKSTRTGGASDTPAASGGSADTGTSTAPVLSAGVLLTVVPGGKLLEALDPTTGAKRWDVDITPYATVRPIADAVLLATPTGRVRYLDSATGSELWSGRHGGTGSQWVAADGNSGPLFVTTTSADGASTLMSAVDRETGDLLWEKRTTGNLAPVAADGDALYLLSRNSFDAADAVVRLDTAGHAVRRFPLPSPVDQPQATAAGGVVYLMGFSGSLLALDTGAGGDKTQRWRTETSVTYASAPVVVGDRVYLSAGDGRLLAVDAGSGALLGQTKPRMAGGTGTLDPSLPAPVSVHGKIYAGAPDGSVFAVDGQDPARW